MKAWRFVVLLAILAVFVLALAACGSPDEDTPGVLPDPAPAAVDEDTEAPPDAAEEEVRGPTPLPDFPDLGGRVITITTIDASGFFGINPDGISVAPDMATDPHYFINRMRYDNRVAMEEAFNVTIVPIVMGWGEVTHALLASVLAGEPLSDIVYMPGTHGFTHTVRGNIMQLDTVARADSDLLNDQIHVAPRIVRDGHIYSFAQNLINTGQQGVLVNLDLIHQFGLPNPVELWERGEWTFDAFREIARLGTQDTTGDGTIDLWGTSGQLNATMRHLISANDGWMIEPTTLTYAYDSPATMEALQLVYDFLFNGWWQPPALDAPRPTTMHAPSQRTWEEGRAVMATAVPPAHVQRGFDAGFTGNVAFLPFPTGPNNTRGYTSNAILRNGFSIPIGVEDPENIIFFLEQVLSWARDDDYLIMEGAIDHLRAIFDDEADVQRVLENARNGKYDMGIQIDGFYWFHADMMVEWWYGTMTVAEAVEAQRDNRQHFIENFFNPIPYDGD